MVEQAIREQSDAVCGVVYCFTRSFDWIIQVDLFWTQAKRAVAG